MKGKSYTVSGTAWGDEGKAKVLDFIISLLTRLGAIIRHNGGANAGHTVVTKEIKFAFHLIASGIFHPGIKCISGSGMVIDPVVYGQERSELQKLGVNTEGRLIISDRAHLTFPWHKYFEKFLEESMGQGKIGTTRRGIGPTYSAKALRSLAIRAGDVRYRGFFLDQFTIISNWWEKLFHSLGLPEAEIKQMAEESEAYYEAALELEPLVKNTDGLATRLIDEGQSVLNEMAQGPGLDMDYGTYPFNTSSNTFPPFGLKEIGWSDVVVAIVKAYTTRVGEGPLVGELEGEEADTLRERGKEYGTTTGRPRRVSWLDLPATRYYLNLMKTPHTEIRLAVTKLDVLDGFEKIKVLTGYRLGDTVYPVPPSSHRLVLEECKPVYEELHGWQTDISGCRTMKELPNAAQMYLAFLSDQLGFPVSFVSVGAEREQTIVDW